MITDKPKFYMITGMVIPHNPNNTIRETNTFKSRAAEIKAKFNHKFNS